MTTVAWDGKSLAGDSFCNRGGLKHLVRTKVWRLLDGRLFGGCGALEDVLATKAWLDEGGDDPKVDSDFAALLVETDGRCWLLGSQSRVRQPLPFSRFAIGSGRDFAIAAMHLGKSAREAVQLSSRFDVGTAGKVTVLELKA